MYTQFFLLFAMIFSGYALRKLNIIDEVIVKGLNKFVLYFAFTALIISNMGSLELKPEILKTMGITFLVIVLIYILTSVFARFYQRVRNFPDRIRPVVELSMANPNNGFMGFPIALVFFGEEGMLYMAIHSACLYLYLFSYGTMRIKGHKTESLKVLAKSILKVFANPIIIGVIAGLLIGILGIPLDNPIGLYLETVGGIATPLSMILIGGTLAGSNFFDMFKNHIVWETALCKNIIIPVLTFALVYFLPIDFTAKAIIVLGGAMPAGATIVMMANEHNNNPELASKILFFSTALSMATIPLALWLIELMA